MMNCNVERAEELRLAGMAAMRTNDPEQAVRSFDEALRLVGRDDDLRELIVINKAGALIELERSGPEVQQLTQIIMRRRSAKHTFLAAYNVQNKYAIEGDYKRASFYAQLALTTAEAASELEWRLGALLALGILSGLESKFTDEIAYYERILELSPEGSEDLRLCLTLQNLGYSHLMIGSTEKGLELIHQAVEMMARVGAQGFAPESYLDLCLGYLELGRFDRATHYGELGMECATEVRQVRNAHYLLGEAAFKAGDTESASFHFEKLAKFYPDFPNLKNLLFAIDLRGFVNFKL
ncbi:MAG TPA: tetratricopeptide repeat protein [Thermoanaerobaculia bacterium]|nr:tetratricopeptide repeat protein [Thermoanaerobaculia bacterium]